jgi:hypothetical protein
MDSIVQGSPLHWSCQLHFQLGAPCFQRHRQSPLRRPQLLQVLERHQATGLPLSPPWAAPQQFVFVQVGDALLLRLAQDASDVNGRPMYAYMTAAGVMDFTWFQTALDRQVQWGVLLDQAPGATPMPVVLVYRDNVVAQTPVMVAAVAASTAGLLQPGLAPAGAGAAQALTYDPSSMSVTSTGAALPTSMLWHLAVCESPDAAWCMHNTSALAMCQWGGVCQLAQSFVGAKAIDQVGSMATGLMCPSCCYQTVQQYFCGGGKAGESLALCPGALEVLSPPLIQATTSCSVPGGSSSCSLSALGTQAYTDLLYAYCNSGSGALPLGAQAASAADCGQFGATPPPASGSASSHHAGSSGSHAGSSGSHAGSSGSHAGSSGSHAGSSGSHAGSSGSHAGSSGSHAGSSGSRAGSSGSHAGSSGSHAGSSGSHAGSSGSHAGSSGSHAGSSGSHAGSSGSHAGSSGSRAGSSGSHAGSSGSHAGSSGSHAGSSGSHAGSSGSHAGSSGSYPSATSSLPSSSSGNTQSWIHKAPWIMPTLIAVATAVVLVLVVIVPAIVVSKKRRQAAKRLPVSVAATPAAATPVAATPVAAAPVAAAPVAATPVAATPVAAAPVAATPVAATSVAAATAPSSTVLPAAANAPAASQPLAKPTTQLPPATNARP